MTNLPDILSLQRESRWLRALARELVSDPGRAEDLAQDTWVAALESGPRPGTLRRAWVSIVMRRRLHEERRASAARTDRETRASRREALPSTLDMVERAAIQRDLVAAVLELDEPYRTTVLWRFFEELSAREIAQRARIPVATVHTRLARGLERLRGRLERDHGDGRPGSAHAALSAILMTPRGTTFLGASLMKTSTKVGLTALLVVSGVGAWRMLSPDDAGSREPTVPSALAASPEAEGVNAADAGPAGPGPERGARASAGAATAATVAGASVPGATEAPAPGVVVRGRALDARGASLAGARLTTNPVSDRTVETDREGRFELALERVPRTIVSADPRYATVLAGAGASQGDSIVVLAPLLELGGTVVDENGAELRGVELAVHLPRGFGADFGTPLDSALTLTWGATSDEHGGFALHHVPYVQGALLTAQLGAFEPASEPLPAVSTRDLRLVLKRSRGSATSVRGVVVDPAGAFVRGARVALGSQTVFSDAGGRFEVDAAQTPAPTRLTAVARGFQRAEAEKPAGPWPAEVVLRLGGEPLVLQGRVLDGQGQALAGARVWIADPTPFGLVDGEPLSVEQLVDGADLRFFAFVESDSEGRFRLGGLAAREYTLQALDPRTLVQAEGRATGGTQGLEIRLPKDAVFPKVLGRVVTADGAGIAGVSVQLQRPGFTVEFPSGGTRDEYSHREPVTTDAEGRFEMLDVPRSGAEIFASGDAILFAYVAVEPATDPEHVVIRAHLRMHLQVELDPPVDRVDELRVLDEDGKPLLLRIMRGPTSFTNRRAEIVDGRSQVLSLSDEARTLVLYRAQREIVRIAIRLTRDRVEVVRY